MKISHAKLHAYSMAEVEDSISLVRRCEIKSDKGRLGYLVVNSNTTPTDKKDKFIAVYFNAGLREDDGPNAICNITPKEYKDILNGKRKLPKGWVLKEILFDGIFIYDNIDDLIKSVQNWPYFVEIDDNPMLKILGFKCKSGRKWQIKLSDYKKTVENSKLIRGNSFSTNENKNLFTQLVLNTKLPFVFS